MTNRTVATDLRQGGESGGAHPLWRFLAAISGVSDEVERARLTATAVPSLIRCSVSGLALFNETDESWNLLIQRNGEQLGPVQTKRIVTELQEPFLSAFRVSTALTADGGADADRIPPAMRELAIQHVALTPLMTLRHRIGVLLVGRESPEPMSREEVLTLSTLAAHLAIGLENQRLYR